MYFVDEVPINFCLNSEKRKFRSPFLEVLDLEKFKKEILECYDYINAPNMYGNTILHAALNNPKCDVREVKLLLNNGAKLELKNKVGDTPLSFAAYYNVNVEVVKLLLEMGANVNATNNFLDTPLHRALDKHITDLEVVGLLLDYKADMNKLNLMGDSPLHYCLNNNPDVHIVKLLLDRGADSRLVDKYRNTLLHLALDREYNMEVIELLMDVGIPINSRNGGGDTPLQLALRNLVCRPDIIKFLLENGANCNLPNNNCYYPLQTALKNVASTMEVFQLLLSYGARVNESDLTGNSVLHTACISFSNCNVETISLLLNRGANINAVNNCGETPLTFAVMGLNCKPDVIKLLLERGASLQMADTKGDQPLHAAVKRVNCTVDIVKLMLDHGANVNKINNFGRTPLCLALESRKLNVDVIKFLLNNGANVNAVNAASQTPLHYALQNPICTAEVLSLLLEQRARLDAINSLGDTPMHIAMRNGNVKFFKFFLEHRGSVNLRNRYGKYPIQYAIKKYNSAPGLASKDFVKLLIKYSLLETLSFDVEYFLDSQCDSDEFFAFARDCRDEIRKMHEEYVARGRKLCELVCDRKVPVKEKWLEMDWDIKNLLDILVSGKYPIYSDAIASSIKREAMIFKLKDNVVHTVSKDFYSQSVLNFHSACYLAEQLSNEDLLNLLLAFHNRRGNYCKRSVSYDPENCGICYKRMKMQKNDGSCSSSNYVE